MFGKASNSNVPAYRLVAALASNPAELIKARDAAWRAMQTAPTQAAFEAARDTYETLTHI